MLKRGDLFHERYVIKSVLGVGGMGAVYLAEDQSNKQQVALKILKRELSDNPTIVKRFMNEGQIGRKLSFDHIVKIYDHTSTKDGDYYLTMEYVEGGSVRDILGKDGKAVPFAKLPQILVEIAKAISYLHDKKVVHRDLKPENILIAKNGKIKLSDFGIALSLEETQRITATQSGMLGTFQYLSPEQWGGSSVDHRADIYAFGIIAFELATGKVPFEYGSYHAIDKALQEGTVPEIGGKDGIPHWFQDLIEKCLEKDKKIRFQSMEAVLELLSENENSFHLPRGILRLKKAVTKISPGIRNAILGLFFSLISTYSISAIPGLRGSGFLTKIFETKVTDIMYLIRGRIPPPEGVVIVTLDDETFAKLNIPSTEVLPREVMAKALLNLKQLNPKKIALDFVYLTEREQKSDLALQDALKSTGAYLGKFQDVKQVYKNGEYESDNRWIVSHSKFTSTAGGEFYGNLLKDNKIVRRFSFQEGSGHSYPEISAFLFGEEVEKMRLPSRLEFINYYGPVGSVRNISMASLLDDSNLPSKEIFDGKVVFIGKKLLIKEASDLSDVHITPNGIPMWGVEIHATVVGNLLEENWIKRLSLYNEILAVMLTSALLCFLILNLQFIHSLSMYFFLLIAWPILNFILFLKSWFFPGSGIIILLSLVFLPKLIVYLYADRKRKKLFSS